jgi:hypothetical protein
MTDILALQNDVAQAIAIGHRPRSPWPSRLVYVQEE